MDSKLFKRFHMHMVKQWTKQLLATNDGAENAVGGHRGKPSHNARDKNRDGDGCCTYGFNHAPHQHFKKGKQIIKERKEDCGSYKITNYCNKAPKKTYST